MMSRLWNYWKFPLAFLVIGIVFFLSLGGSLVPLAVAFLLAYLLFPLIKRLEAKGIPRAASSLTLFVLVIVVLGGALFFFTPLIVGEAVTLFRNLPHMLEAFFVLLNKLGGFVGLSKELTPESFLNLETLHKLVGSFGQTEGELLSHLLKSTFSNLSRFFVQLFSLCLLPVFFYYCVDKFELIIAECQKVAPHRYHKGVKEFISIVQDSFGKFFRGQFIVALTLSVLYSLGLSLASVPFGILVGLCTGLLGLVPYLGHVLGFVSSVLLIAFHWEGPAPLIACIVVFGLLITLESYILTPKIVGEKVGLNAFITLLALIIFGEWLGIFGMFIAIPSMYLLKTYYEKLLCAYRSSDFFLKT